MTFARRVPFYWLCWAIVIVPAYAQDERLPPAVALDPADGIIEAFRSHSVVAMGEGVGHGHEQGHAFLRTLIRDPRFARIADDIVVEWGNSLYQDVIDRFTRGEDVPYGERPADRLGIARSSAADDSLAT